MFNQCIIKELNFFINCVEKKIYIYISILKRIFHFSHKWFYCINSLMHAI